jgi:peptide methionine sulfoxide reductase msrA/msrB
MKKNIILGIILALTTIFILSLYATKQQEGKKVEYKKLTPEEEKVIINKGTEAPFSGKYLNYNEDGTYTCKRCGASLYLSKDKFESHCGWPSFDDEIPGAIKKVPDADGQRTEIQCSNCGAHLGHVFYGENYTSKNTRYCVNSISLGFVPAKNEETLQKAYFAGGCFWGVEYHFQKIKGVSSTAVGYMGGTIGNPTYEQVCTGKTGYAEAIEITYDPAVVTYENLAKFFFEIHDPTEFNRQGPDIGNQYRSVVFYTNDDQKETALKLIGILKSKGYEVVTAVEKAGKFWEGEKYHQDYYKRNGKLPYCHFYKKRF